MGTALTSPILPSHKVAIFRHGHAAPAEKDFERELSLTGIEQAQALAKKLAPIPFRTVIPSSAPRAKRTAELAMEHVRTPFRTVQTKSSWFYSPKREEEEQAFWKLFQTVPLLPYAGYLEIDRDGIIPRFQAEMLLDWTWINGPGGEFQAEFVAVFNHAIVSNMLAAALFPQHAEAIGSIVLEPCDGILLTESTVWHYQHASDQEVTF